MNSVGVGREYLERYGDRPEADQQILKVNAYGSADVRALAFIRCIHLVFQFISCVLAPMERNGGGQIVVLSSSQGFRPIPLLAAYSAAKSMISFICEAVDREYKTINVQCLTPALIATKMTYYQASTLPSSLNSIAFLAVGLAVRRYTGELLPPSGQYVGLGEDHKRLLQPRNSSEWEEKEGDDCSCSFRCSFGTCSRGLCSST